MIASSCLNLSYTASNPRLSLDTTAVNQGKIGTVLNKTIHCMLIFNLCPPIFG